MKPGLRLSLILLATCALHSAQAMGQGRQPAGKAQGQSRLSVGKIKSKTPVVLAENDQRKEYVDLYTKVLKLNPDGLKVIPGSVSMALPDLTIADVGVATVVGAPKEKGYVKVMNKGPGKSARCNLRFRYGMYLLDDASLATMDFQVPPIEPGKFVIIHFAPPSEDVNWWIFGVNLDPDHAMIKETTQANNAYVIEAETGEKFLTPKP